MIILIIIIISKSEILKLSLLFRIAPSTFLTPLRTDERLDKICVSTITALLLVISYRSTPTFILVRSKKYTHAKSNTSTH